MPEFRIFAQETVEYCVVIKAKNREEVNKLIYNGDMEWGNPVDGYDFKVTSVVPEKEFQNRLKSGE